jgi:hypothetical protein
MRCADKHTAMSAITLSRKEAKESGVTTCAPSTENVSGNMRQPKAGGSI